MPYHKNSYKNPKIGDVIALSRKHESCAGYFEAGDVVKIVGIDPIRGFEIEDDQGNRMTEVGFEL